MSSPYLDLEAGRIARVDGKPYSEWETKEWQKGWLDAETVYNKLLFYVEKLAAVYNDDDEIDPGHVAGIVQCFGELHPTK